MIQEDPWYKCVWAEVRVISQINDPGCPHEDTAIIASLEHGQNVTCDTGSLSLIIAHISQIADFISLVIYVLGATAQ